MTKIKYSNVKSCNLQSSQDVIHIYEATMSGWKLPDDSHSKCVKVAIKWHCFASSQRNYREPFIHLLRSFKALYEGHFGLKTNLGRHEWTHGGKTWQLHNLQVPHPSYTSSLEINRICPESELMLILMLGGRKRKRKKPKLS